MNTSVILRPSKAAMWSRCAAAVGRELSFTGESSDAARWGTACHEVAAAILQYDIPPREFVGLTIEGVKVTSEMAAVAKSYVDYLATLGCDQSWSEISLPDTAIPFCGGTADWVGYRSIDRTLIVVDLKTGYDPVVAVKNDQGVPYMHGALNHVAPLDVDAIHFTIYQPRLDRIDTWEVTPQELQAEVERLTAAAKNALSASPVATPGKVQCKWCLAAAHCPELASAVRELILVPVAKDPAVLAQQYELVPMAEHWIKSVGNAARGALTSGQGLPGYKLVQGRRGPRKWRSDEEVEAVAEMLAAPLFERSLMTPAKVEKLAPEAWPQFMQYVTQSDGKPAIAPEDDPRAAINPADDFKD